MIVVGLGNPGQEYAHTRHNVGFAVLDALAIKLEASPWKTEFGARWTRVGEHWLIEPMEFMNTAGPALRRFSQKKKLQFDPATELFVVHDDVDFPLGEIHQQFDRSAAGHHGVQSLIDAVGTKNFGRLRIGIGRNRELSIPAEDYVLQKFSVDEQPVINQAIDQAVTMLTKKIPR